MANILLIADRQTTMDSLKDNIEQPDFRIITASNQREALRLARHERPDVVLFDSTGSRINGPKLCRALRRLIDLPVVAIVREAHEAVELLAHDHLIKPYSARQLREVIHRALEYPRELKVGPIRLNLRERVVHVAHRPDPRVLRPKLFSLLRLLMHHEGKVVTREKLMGDVWNTDFLEDTRTLDVHVRWLRQVIEPDPSSPRHLHTAWGKGYFLNAGTPDDSPREGAS